MDFDPQEQERPLWRNCELAFQAWLSSQGHVVTPLCDAVSNTAKTGAPMIQTPSGALRAPDLQSVHSGRMEYWEIKFRSRPLIDDSTGLAEHRVDFAAFSDYHKLWKQTNVPVWIVVYEAATATSAGRWLRVSVASAAACGRRADCWGSSGEIIESWLWPVDDMEVVSAPIVKQNSTSAPLASDDEVALGADIASYHTLERQLRNSLDEVRVEDGKREPIIEDDRLAGLEALRRALGIPVRPRYSVLLVGGEGVSIPDLQGLVQYGIRVFAILEEKPNVEDSGVQALIDAHMLTYAASADVGSLCEWIVDGQFDESLPELVNEALEYADRTGELNLKQYKIVHAPTDSDVLVTAGAGTGKTETMSERLVFLLATVDEVVGLEGPGKANKPQTLRVDEIALITFSREAAREMRQRIAKVIALRQRLCRLSVLPTTAWLMQLGNAQISTIHAFSKRLVRQDGVAIGFSPATTVSNETMFLRDQIAQVLSSHLVKAYASFPKLPAAHLWVKHIEAVWAALENNGVALIPFGSEKEADSAIEWIGRELPPDNKLAAEITRDVLTSLSESVGDAMRDKQRLRTSQLIPAALQVVRSRKSIKRRQSLRFLFVDEFQDTDELQIQLILEARAQLRANLFVVGDIKQGVYRFRGAAGDAFNALNNAVKLRGEDEFSKFTRTRTSRSDGVLLDSLHHVFQSWGKKDLISYEDEDKLQPRGGVELRGKEFATKEYRSKNFHKRAQEQVLEWRETHPDDSIAILCRRNSHAIQVHQAIRSEGESCRLLLGGSFYQSEAVKEMRVLVEAIRNPSDDAALLELCETRWVARMLREGSPFETDIDVWNRDINTPQPWNARFASIIRAHSFEKSDLELLRARVQSIRELLRKKSALSLLVECQSKLAPHKCARNGEAGAERRQYSLNLDHLITRMDETFGDSPATLSSILSWLELQIATNETEDEPAYDIQNKGQTTALTVHKAKGLEFDRVLIANTWTRFEVDFPGTSVSVVSKDQAKHLLWKWKTGEGTIANSYDEGLVKNDYFEVRREEARLLYVAMTRARKELLIFKPKNMPSAECWAHLLP